MLAKAGQPNVMETIAAVSGIKAPCQDWRSISGIQAEYKRNTSGIQAEYKRNTSGIQAEHERNTSEHPASPWLAPRYQVRLSRLASEADSRGLGPPLRVNQVKQSSDHSNDRDTSYQPTPYGAHLAPPTTVRSL